MAIDQSTRMKAEAELRLGKKSKDIASKYDIPYVTVRGWAKKIEIELTDSNIDTLIEYDEVTLNHMADEIKELAPTKVEVKKVEKLAKDVIGLKRLEEKTRSVAFTILNKLEAQLAISTEVELKELKEASIIVSTLHTALFSKNVTQVNVMNQNTISTEKRDIFKSSLGA